LLRGLRRSAILVPILTRIEFQFVELTIRAVPATRTALRHLPATNDFVFTRA
jgi:hypothetical protein